LVLPTLYNLVEGAKERRAARRGETAPQLATAPVATVHMTAGGEPIPATRRERKLLEAAATGGIPIVAAPVVVVASAEAAQAAATAAAAAAQPAEAPGAEAEAEVAETQLAEA